MQLDAAVEAALAMVGGLALDAIMGDPAVSWHPVRLIGRLASCAEGLARRLWRAQVAPECHNANSRGAAARASMAGASAWLAVVAVSAGAALALSSAAHATHPLAGLFVDSLVVWASIAPADLAAHAARVRRALLTAERGETGGIGKARAALAMIVGRDVSSLDTSGVARAAVESVAESSIDGAAAPLFWAALLGPWAAFAYRAVNTMDSMFGHKNERYRKFGFVAAKADDLANWLPARLSSVLACFMAPFVGGSIRATFGSLSRWRLAHESPNAGHPEAAYAGALGLRLGGPSRYAEGLIDKPWLNPEGGEAATGHIARATRLMYLQTVLSAVCFMALRLATQGLFHAR